MGEVVGTGAWLTGGEGDLWVALTDKGKYLVVLAPSCGDREGFLVSLRLELGGHGTSLAVSRIVEEDGDGLMIVRVENRRSNRRSCPGPCVAHVSCLRLSYDRITEWAKAASTSNYSGYYPPSDEVAWENPLEMGVPFPTSDDQGSKVGSDGGDLEG